MRITTWSLWLILLAVTLAAAQEQPERKALTIAPQQGEVTLDGDLQEWSLEAPAIIRLDEELDDFWGEAWLCWDDEFLWAAFRVYDSSPLQNAGDDPFLAFKTGDTVELFLCTDPEADPTRPEPVLGDYRILLTYLQNEKPVVFAYHPVSTGEPKYISHPSGAWRTRVDEAQVIPEAQFAAQRNPEEGYYTAEARIPLKFFPDFQPQPQMKIPFNWALNFSDMSGQKNIMKLWWNGTNTMCTDVPHELRLYTSTWGWAIFGDEEDQANQIARAGGQGEP